MYTCYLLVDGETETETRANYLLSLRDKLATETSGFDYATMRVLSVVSGYTANANPLVAKLWTIKAVRHAREIQSLQYALGTFEGCHRTV